MKTCDKSPYQGMRIYGPYRRKDGRQHVVLVDSLSGKKITVSYPKFLVEIDLGRKLHPDLETVDHINRNFNDNSLKNLRVIPRDIHTKQDATLLEYLEMNCVLCGAQVPTSRVKNRYRNSHKNIAGPFCSRTCSGKYGASIRSGSKKAPSVEVPVKRYQFQKV